MISLVWSGCRLPLYASQEVRARRGRRASQTKGSTAALGGCRNFLGSVFEALALALGTWAFSGSSAMADDGGYDGMAQGPKVCQGGSGLLGRDGPGYGTLGYGGPGLYPGFQGFGLGYHPGYGYGGDALGVGADGGYPFYGGPGYPHPWPRLRRIGGITPFPYFGGPGYPSPGNPNYFGGVGPLVADRPVVEIGREPGEAGYASGYGCFTGALPYPESTFAPFTATAAVGGSSSGVSSSSPSTPATNPAPAAGSGQPSASIPPATGETTNLPAQGRALGIDEEPVIDASGVWGMKVSKVYPGSAAEKAGLHAGDVIHSINGYLTTQPGNLAWIIANAVSDNVLMMNVRTASDGKEHTITAHLP